MTGLVWPVAVDSRPQVTAFDFTGARRAQQIAGTGVAVDRRDQRRPVLAAQQHRMAGAPGEDGAGQHAGCGRSAGEESRSDACGLVRQVDKGHQGRIASGRISSCRGETRSERGREAARPVLRHDDHSTHGYQEARPVGLGAEHDQYAPAPDGFEPPHGVLHPRSPGVVAAERFRTARPTSRARREHHSDHRIHSIIVP